MVTDLANALQVRFLLYERSNIKGQCHEFMETVTRDMVTDLANALQVSFLCLRSYIKGQCHEFMETVARDMVTDLANALQVRPDTGKGTVSRGISKRKGKRLVRQVVFFISHF